MCNPVGELFFFFKQDFHYESKRKSQAVYYFVYFTLIATESLLSIQTYRDLNKFAIWRKLNALNILLTAM